MTSWRPSGEPLRALGINQSSQSGRLPHDWEEMRPNGIRLWPGRWCLRPCHSILLCDCDHGRQTARMAGNKTGWVLDWNSEAGRKHTDVGGTQEAGRWHTTVAGGRRRDHSLRKQRILSRQTFECLCVCADHPLIECPKGHVFGFSWPERKTGQTNSKNWPFLSSSHPAFRINEPIYYFCQSSNTNTYKHSRFGASVPEERPPYAD